MTLAAGTRLGLYEILSPLGEGGMGEVYRARDSKLEREVALKVLGPGLLADESARRRFHREALALAKLNHPHVAQVYDFASEGGVDFLVMELVPGEALSERSAFGPLPEADVVRYGLELAAGLRAAHAEGVVHCDLKPANLRLTREGEVKILDFGLARLRRPSPATGEANETLGSTDLVVSGTLPYMAPEQLRAERLDERTDVWAAGIVLYELATGTRPFRDTVPAKLTDAILHAAAEPPSQRLAGVSPGLQQVILKCLEKDAGRRYQSAGELRLDLERLQNPAAAPAAASRPRPLVRVQWIVAGTALAALLSAVVVMKPWRGSGSAPAASGALASLAVLPLDNMTGDPGQEYFADGMTDALITELARIRSLKVISRTSVMRFKKTDKALPEIAKQLGVEGIVEGSVSRGSGRVKITAQLIQASSDTHLWADSFERAEADVLALQGEVARAIAGQVRAAITPAEAGRLDRRRKVKPEAYDLVLQGEYLVKSAGGPDAFQRAIALLEKAIALDPGSVEAHAGLAIALQHFSLYGFASYADVSARIRKEVDAALKLDADYSWAQLARAQLLWADGDPRGCLDAQRRAVELDPGNSTALTAYAGNLAYLERGSDAERLLKKAIEMDPLAQLPRCNYKDVLYGQRRYAEAEEQARKTLDLDPNWFWAWDQLWRIHVREGKLQEAQEESRKAWAVAYGDDFKPPPDLTWEAYERWLDRFLEGQTRYFPGFLAANYARRGEKAKALDFLEQAATRNDAFLGLLDWPDFDPIREEPRFRKIVEDRRLPVASLCRIPSRKTQR
jgi:TolB-like protein/Tfp pilus assembly protein PilF